MQTPKNIIQTDLDLITNSLGPEFARMSGRSVLIAGGAGFLGYYLVQGALHWSRCNPRHSPIQITVLDSFVRGMAAWLEALHSEPNLRWERHDITKPLRSDLGDYQYLIHAASIASPTYYRRCPIETMDANVTGLRQMLDYCSAQIASGKTIEGMLFYSSSEIYGDPSSENIPTPETYRGNVSCTGPRACYDESKRYGETLCVNFARQRGVPVKIARPFNNYGPGLKITDRRVIPDFARDIMAGRDIVMLSDGTPKRTFCYVADAVIGYYKILTRGRPGEPYNIGVEAPEISVAELAEKIVLVARELGYNGRVVHQKSQDEDYLVDNPGRRCPMITKARTELGYDPVVRLDEGLRRSLIWYTENQEATEA
jgi:UDP-glucuronate decarboxylase